MSVFFTVGPSQLYPTVAQHMHEAFCNHIGSINHRSQKFRDIYKECDEALRALMNIPKSHAIFFTNSATEIWERIILNTVEKKSFHFVNGAFAKRFYEYAIALGKDATKIEVEHGFGFEINSVEIEDEVELICTTQNETSSGVRMPPEDLVLLKQKYPNKLLCTDLVSSAPIEKVNFEYIDMAFFSVQKAFGLPPGLGVWIVNENCLHKMEKLKQKGINIGAHFTLESFFKNYKNFETPSTPNVIGIYLLSMVTKDLLKKGIEQIREETMVKKQMIEDAISSSSVLELLVKEEKWRSLTTIVAKTKIDSKRMIDKIKVDLNFIVGSGYGNYKSSEIRIANFPATSLEQMFKLCNFINKI